MIIICSDCGHEFEGDASTDRCPECGAGKDAFVVQPFNVMSEFESHTNLNDVD